MKLALLILLSAGISYGQEYLNEFLTVYYSNVYNGKTLDESGLKTELSNIQSKILSSNLSESQKLITQIYADSSLAAIDSPISDEWKIKLNDLYTKAMNTDDGSAEFLSAKAYIISQIMGYKPLSELIKLSKQSLDYYEQALKKDNTCFNAYLGAALWYYFAPRIGGGNVGTTIRYLNNGEKYAVNDIQKFQILVWKSQAYFRQNKKDLTAEYLGDALKIFPDSSWVEEIKAMNAKGRFFK